MSQFLRSRLLAAICMLSATGVPAMAEPVPTEFADTVMTLPQVSVTYIKSGTNPSKDEAVTTLGQTEIERLNVVNIKQVSEIAPNFYMPQYGSRMTSSVYVRGLGTRIDQPVVGLNIDNVPIINKDNFDFDLPDITRIEILRGPQNILYGRNTMGGLINIYTLSPFSFEGVRLQGEFGSANSYKASASIYRKLSPYWGMSLNLYTSGTDGFFRNETNNSHVGRERQWSARWKTQWRPSGSLTMENTTSVARTTQNGYPYESVATDRIEYNDTCFYRRLTVTDGLTANANLGGVTISGIASFQYINDNMTLDQDFLPLDYFTLTQKRHEWVVTGDIVARNRTSATYNWLTGAFGFARRTNMNAPVTFFDYGLTTLIEQNANAMNPQYPIRWDQRQLLLGSEFVMPSQGASLYHESMLKTGAFTFTLGLRWDWERTEIRYHSHSYSTYTIYDTTSGGNEVYKPAIPVDIDDNGQLSKSFSQLLPKLSVSYNIPGDQGNIFASVTKGFKSGGYNTQMFSDVLQQRIMGLMGIAERYNVEDIISYDPEKTWNYELGAHLSLLDHKLQLDLAAFWIECRDQQLTTFPKGSITGRIMANAGKSRSRGAEISAVADLPAGFNLRASYGYTDAEFIDFSNGKQDFSGNKVPYAPSNTLFLGLTYRHHFHRNSIIDMLTINVSTRGFGRIQWDEANSLSQPFTMLLETSVKADRGNLSLEAWADNITDANYATFRFSSIGNSFLQRGNPFSCGLTLRYALQFD